MGRGTRKGKKKKVENQTKGVVFFKHFIIGFLAFIILLFPVFLLVDKIGNAKVLAGPAVEADGSADGADTAAVNGDMPDSMTDTDSPFYEMFQDTNRVNVLLLGINGDMTDTIMVGSYDLDDQRVDVISVPRDTYYERPGADSPGAKKINAVYHKGRAEGTAQAVSDVLLGMPIHYYAVVKYDGVKEVVDAIGGVPVNIPFDMDYDDIYDKPPLHLHFKEGPKTLSGEEAVKYLRYRKDNKDGYGYAQGDIGRIAAQQEFIKSAIKESIGLGLPKVVSTAVGAVESNVTVAEAVKLATSAVGLSSENIEGHQAPGEATMKDGASYWMVDEDAVGDLLRQIYLGKENVPGAVLKGNTPVGGVL